VFEVTSKPFCSKIVALINGTMTKSALEDDTIRAATWDDVLRDNKGTIVSILGQSIDEFKVVQLRLLCQSLKLQGYKSSGKSALIKMLTDYAANRSAYNVDKANQSPQRKTMHCSFRLLNILFSDEFAEDFSKLGDIPKRHELDNNSNTYCQEDFWKAIVPAYVTPSDKFNDVMFYDDVLRAENINPSIILTHDWRRLRDIWRDTQSKYKECNSNYTLSGNHDSSFLNFCQGRLDVYYLHLQLAQRPQLQAFVDSSLPSDVFSDSLDDGTFSESVSPNGNSTVGSIAAEKTQNASPPNKKLKSSRPDFKKMQDNVSAMVQNIGIPKDFFATQSHDSASRYLLEKEETVLVNLERIKTMIGLTRKELKEATDDNEKADLEKDLERLLAQKEKYFNELPL
jgi:hypothetical protein